MRIGWLVPALCIASPAFANDKPAVGPAPSWVKVIDAPPPDTNTKSLPVAVLLSDQQVRFEPGRQTVYSETIFKVQTPQGLSAGNISIPWRPDTDTITVHKLVIHRGDKLIDVIAAGQTFTVIRREPNLESATLDGVLTANIQPEGLQVGDTIDLAISVSSSDPVFKGHVELLTGEWNKVPIGRAHLSAQWPSSIKMRLRESAAFDQLKPIKHGDLTTLEYTADNLKPLDPPRGAPARYQVGRAIEMSDFSSWAELGALMAPLYEKAAVAKSEGGLSQEIAHIRQMSSDPKVRAEAALALVQDRVRYVALAMGAGGLVPADADATWGRRYGDCKAKTALLLAILHALDIRAEPVAVNAFGGDGIDQRLPMVGLFNHVLVRATIGGSSYWLDGTRSGDSSLDRLVTPYFGWGLPLVTNGGALARMVPAPRVEPDVSVTVQVDARAGVMIPAPIHVEMVFAGDAAIGFNQGLSTLDPETRDRFLKEFWRKNYDFVEVKANNVTFDTKTAKAVLAMDGMATLDWKKGYYQLEDLTLGYKADFTRDPGPDRDAPFEVDYPSFRAVKETILLPPSWNGHVAVTTDVDQTIAGVEYFRRSTLANNVFIVALRAHAIAPEFPAKDAAAAQAALRNLAETAVSLRMPSNYTPTPKEIGVAMTQTPTSAEGFVGRGNGLLNLGRFDEAIKDFSAALELNPKNVWALDDRAIARAWKGDYADADRDVLAAAALEPHNLIAVRARGFIAERQGKSDDAIASYTLALGIEPSDSFSLAHRALAYHAAGKDDAALADAANVIKTSPAAIDMYLLRANIFRNSGRKAAALTEAAALTSANADDAYAQTVAGAIYSTFHMDSEAINAYDRAIAIKPEPYIYLDRSERRPKRDVAGRRADIDAALKLDPGSRDALLAKASLASEVGDFPNAIAAYSGVIEKEPGSVKALVERGVAYFRKGDVTAATKDFDQARARASNPVLLNNLCWEKAIAGIALESALNDCDAALGPNPTIGGFLDSRGLVKLRLGRFDDAIADYTKALAINPHMAGSRFGRGIAYLRKGDTKAGAADIAAAMSEDIDVEAAFLRYGISAPK